MSATPKDFILKNGLEVQGFGSPPSTSTYTGAVVVDGGVGISGDVHANNFFAKTGEVVTVGTLGNNAVTAIYAGTDTVVSAHTGSVTVWNNSTFESVTERGSSTTHAISILNSQESSSIVSGAFTVTGGVGIGKNIKVGGSATVGEKYSNFLKLSGSATGDPLKIESNGTEDSTVNISIVAKGTGTVSITSLAVSSSTLSENALYVAGGLGINDAVYGNNGFYDKNERLLANVTLEYGPGINISGTRTGNSQTYKITNIGVTATFGTTYLGVSAETGAVTFTNLGVQTLTAGTDTAVSSNTGTITVWNTSTLQSITNRGATTNNVISISNDTQSSSTTNGALTIAGGVGISKNLNVGGSLKITGAATFSDSVTFNGSATYVYSTNTWYTDNIIELHVPPTGVGDTWSQNDGKDIGLRFHYFDRPNNIDRNAALVLANDSLTLEWYSAGYESDLGTFTNATYGGFKLSDIQLVSENTNTQNATSGALTVAGGVGIRKNVWIGGISGTESSTTVNKQGLVINENGLGVTGDSYFNKNVGIGGSLTVGEKSTFRKSLTVNENFSVTGTSILSDNVTVKKDLSIYGNVTGTGFVASGIFSITNTTTAVDYVGSGALQVAGGVGIQKDLYVNGNINVNGTINVTGGLIANTATNLANGTSGSIPYQRNPGETQFVSGTAGQILVSGGTNTPIFQNTLTLAGSISSKSTNTGALQVVGGVGIGENLFVGNNLNVTGITTLTTTTNVLGPLTAKSTLEVNGNFTVSGTSVFSGLTSVTNTSSSNSTNTGALQVVGGVGIGENLFVGNNLNVTGITTLTTTTNVLGPLTAKSTLEVNGNFTVSGTSAFLNDITGTNVILSKNLSVTGTTVLYNTATITSSAVSTSTYTGALIVKGGVGIGGDLWVGGNIYLDGVGLDTISGTTGTFLNLFVTGTNGTVFSVTGNASIGGNLTASSLVVTGTSVLTTLTVTTALITTLDVKNTATIHNLTVTGTSVFSDTLSGTTASFSKNLYVTGTSFLEKVSIGQASQFVSYASASTTTTQSMLLDSFNFNNYRTAEYLAQVVDTSTHDPEKVQIEKFLLFHDGRTPLPTPYLISYGIGFNTSELGTWDAISTGTDIVLIFTPANTPNNGGSINVKTVRTSITR